MFYYCSCFFLFIRLACSAAVIVFTGRRLIETFWYPPNRVARQQARKWKIYDSPTVSLSYAVCAWTSVTFDGIKQTVNWLENKQLQLNQAVPPPPPHHAYRKSWHTLQIASSSVECSRNRKLLSLKAGFDLVWAYRVFCSHAYASLTHSCLIFPAFSASYCYL